MGISLPAALDLILSSLESLWLSGWGLPGHLLSITGPGGSVPVDSTSWPWGGPRCTNPASCDERACFPALLQAALEVTKSGFLCQFDFSSQRKKCQLWTSLGEEMPLYGLSFLLTYGPTWCFLLSFSCFKTLMTKCWTLSFFVLLLQIISDLIA
jgi:hypothetical protein